MLPIDDILESLDLSRAQPGIGFLEALFARFNARVPFESASKILRDAEVEDRDAKPRPPEVFWADHLERGTGGTCFARVAAFDALITGLGFRSRRLLGRVERDDDHSALEVETPAGESIVDVGFPLPAVFGKGAGEIETPLGGLRVLPTERGLTVAFTEGVPEGPRGLEIFSAPVSDERFAEAWKRTFRRGSRFLSHVVLRRDLGNRVVSYAAGHIRVDDLHSRLRLPLASARRAATLAELFEIDPDVLTRAFGIVQRDADAETGAVGSLTAYLETSTDAAKALDAIASPAGYRRLVEGVANVVSEEPTPSGFRLTLRAAGREGDPGGTLSEEVSPDLPARRVDVDRKTESSISRSSYLVLERSGKTYLLREATLSGNREDLLRNDSLRGRLAGSLALDLLAWARML